jgi:hypothetical protein
MHERAHKRGSLVSAEKHWVLKPFNPLGPDPVAHVFLHYGPLAPLGSNKLIRFRPQPARLNRAYNCASVDEIL